MGRRLSERRRPIGCQVLNHFDHSAPRGIFQRNTRFLTEVIPKTTKAFHFNHTCERRVHAARLEKTGQKFLVDKPNIALPRPNARRNSRAFPNQDWKQLIGHFEIDVVIFDELNFNNIKQQLATINLLTIRKIVSCSRLHFN